MTKSNRVLALLLVACGLLMALGGAIDLAVAAGGGGTCTGKATESKFGEPPTWHWQSPPDCEGTCPQPHPDGCVWRKCGSTTGPYGPFGEPVVVDVFTCACIEVSHPEGEIWGWDQLLNGTATCDVQEHRHPSSGALLGKGCLGPCNSGVCTKVDEEMNPEGDERTFKCQCQ